MRPRDPIEHERLLAQRPVRFRTRGCQRVVDVHPEDDGPRGRKGTLIERHHEDAEHAIGAIRAGHEVDARSGTAG